MTDIRSAFVTHALNISARADTEITNTQERAIDLYRRGFNVFPLPIRSKKPYRRTSLKRLFTSRLHMCGDGLEPCRHGKWAPNFGHLFAGEKNIAVICGRTSGNLIDVDCDSLEAFELMGQELDRRGLPYWAFTSRRGGGYLLRVKEGETVNIPKAASRFKDVEVWGHAHFALLPLSIHPSGAVYRWRGDGDPRYQFASHYETLPAVSVTALDWLGVTLLNDEKKPVKPLEMFRLPAKYAVLSERNRETLARGASEGERNNRLYSLACDLAGCGFSSEDIQADFLAAAAACQPVFGERQALSVLKYAYREDRKPAKTAYSVNLTGRMSPINNFVYSYDWRQAFGRKARTRRAVFVACVDRSAIEGPVFRASIRELAEIVNRSYQFVNVCLHDLLNKKLLRLVMTGKDSASGANVYAFGNFTELLQFGDTNSKDCNINVIKLKHQKDEQKTDAFQDVFGVRGLGVVAAEVLRTLQTRQYRSVYAITKDTSAAYNSVKKAVNKLIGHGLAVHSKAEGIYYAEPVTESQLMTVSVHLGTNGRAEMRRIKHNIDREILLNRNLAAAMGLTRVRG